MEDSEKFKAHLMIVTGLLIVFLVTKRLPIIYASLGILLVSIFIPIVGLWIALAWNKFVEILGLINSKIILSVVFFIVLIPIALISRLFKKNPMSLKRSNDASLYSERNHLYTGDDLKNAW